MSPIRHNINQHKGISHHGMGGFREVMISSNKLVMMYSERVWHPPTDVYETPNEIVVKMEISGIEPDEITIDVENTKLIIKGTRPDHDKRTKKVYKQMEINYGALERVIVLHGHIAPNQVKASYNDGFLEVVIPKSAKAPKLKSPKRIKIK